jgi:hydrogenase maturation protease
MEVVVAYGNPLRGDDGVAWRIAEELRARGARVLVSQQLTPELALDLKDASRVVFVDAAAGQEAGEVRWCEVSCATRAAASGHHLTPQGVLAYSRCLNGHAPRAFLVSVTGEDFAVSSALSARVEAAVERTVSLVQDLLGERCTN